MTEKYFCATSGLVQNLKAIQARLSPPTQSITDLIDSVRNLVVKGEGSGGQAPPGVLLVHQDGGASVGTTAAVTGEEGGDEDLQLLNVLGQGSVQLVLEYCDCGSLRDLLQADVFKAVNGSLNYHAILDTAIDVSMGMVHLHRLNIVHADKARNVLLVRNPSEDQGVIAKVSDFGLSIKMELLDTHVSNVFQGTTSHMTPEVLELADV
ncbi:hypothetical protein CEUSTIGMA_g480.t1 [Chlamydomonas eustigma]|uniref:Protein kinase domain-containing protein n=1 Tax=Chlamydomonas eustigma TaxID=1157962 RepID=A0A250WQC5_9CHLO|nr:hypothetical protein CEUSTIGMA_g480.t1 [Chlamydomonas eustigma]|eukprot:GAX73028.1 hypothetical protein CEUSTIGMA_g480.t1 [Chlamydomonas eustigma]